MVSDICYNQLHPESVTHQLLMPAEECFTQNAKFLWAQKSLLWGWYGDATLSQDQHCQMIFQLIYQYENLVSEKASPFLQPTPARLHQLSLWLYPVENERLISAFLQHMRTKWAQAADKMEKLIPSVCNQPSNKALLCVATGLTCSHPGLCRIVKSHYSSCCKCLPSWRQDARV